MKALDIIIIAIIAVCLICAVVYLVKHRGRNCSGDCSGCSRHCSKDEENSDK